MYPQPVRPTESNGRRIVGFDVARALAIFGMVVINFKMVMAPSAHSPGWMLWLLERLEGRAAAVFVILAGVGISLLTHRARRSDHAAALQRHRGSLFKRAFWLLVIGLAYTPLWPADILHFYAFYIAIGALLLAVSDRLLLWLAGGCVALFCVLSGLINYDNGWDWQSLTYVDLWTPAGMLRHLFYNGFHPVFPWTAFLLVGMWLGRRNLCDAVIRNRIILIGASMVILSHAITNRLKALISAGHLQLEVEGWEYLLAAAPMPPSPFYMLSAGGWALIVIAICVWLCDDLRWGGRLVGVLKTTGQLSLTLYVAHVVVGMGILEEMGMLEGQTLPVTLTAAFVFCLLSVGFAVLWRRRHAQGPLEALLRKLAQPRKFQRSRT